MGKEVQRGILVRWLPILLAVALMLLPLGLIQHQISPLSAHQVAARHGPSFNALPAARVGLAYAEAAQPALGLKLIATREGLQAPAQLSSGRDDRPAFHIRPPPSA